jgi:hypothetical protein
MGVGPFGFCVCCAVFWPPQPYYVVLGSREMGYCPYHLRFAYQVLGLRQLLVALRAEMELLQSWSLLKHMCSPLTTHQEARYPREEARRKTCGSPCR